MVVFDASVLLFLFNADTPSSTPRAKERVDFLVNQLSDAGEKIIVPTPALSEALVHAGPAGPTYLTVLNKHSSFRVASFDERSAIEAAFQTYQARQRGQRRGGDDDIPKAKIKFDRQIVAIAIVEGATAVYSDDKQLIKTAREAGLQGYRLEDLDLPPEDRQQSMDL